MTTTQDDDDDDVMCTEISLPFVWHVIFIDEPSVCIRSFRLCRWKSARWRCTRARKRTEGWGRTSTRLWHKYIQCLRDFQGRSAENRRRKSNFNHRTPTRAHPRRERASIDAYLHKVCLHFDGDESQKRDFRRCKYHGDSDGEKEGMRLLDS